MSKILPSLVLLALIPNAAVAQITPDSSLGAEKSIVDSNGDRDTIAGGAIRDTNLFHSFQEFNVGAGREAYFANPNGIANIFSRVTGNNISNILGTLGVLGDANLFFLNPNGIVFGSNARLDVRGSFLGSTADSLLFGNGFEFSASNPQAPPLLTIGIPIGLNFRENPGDIVNQSVANNGNGLEVATGETITLLGGNVNLDGGRIFAGGGRVELGGLSAAGEIGINADASLSFPDEVASADVTLTNGAEVDVRAAGGGSISVNARNIQISGGELGASNLFAGIATDSGSPEAQAGDITLNATNNITVTQGSLIANLMEESGVGNSGVINITTANLSLTQGGQVNASTFAEGNAGGITINASETISADKESQAGRPSGIFSQVLPGARGNSGGINITTANLSLTQGGRVSASTFAEGNAGAITIKVSETIFANGESQDGLNSGILSVVSAGEGESGGINITTANLFLTQGSVVNASTFAEGNAGAIIIEASGTISVDGEGQDGIPSGIFSTVARGARGKSGGIDINTANLSLTRGGVVNALTFAEGNAGAITINASGTISIDAATQADLASGIGSVVTPTGKGKAGGINITTANLSLTQGGVVDASTEGEGDAGSVTISANTLEASKGGQVVSRTSSQFSAGDIILKVKDNITLSGSDTGIFANTTEGSTGKGGNIILEPDLRNLTIQDGATISVDSQGTGIGGDIELSAGFLTLDNGTISAETRSNTGGNIILNLQDLLLLSNDSKISTTAGNQQFGGNGGNITINTPFIVAFPDENSDITANAVQGSGGQINITAQGIFGIEEREASEGNQTNDIDASSEFGLAGVVEINQPDVDPTRGLVELPETVVDPNALVAQNPCKRGSESEFVITGRGGLPPSLNEDLSSDATQVGLVEPASIESRGAEEQGSKGEDNKAISPPSVPTTIIPAQGWVFNERGEIVLVAYDPTVTGSQRLKKNPPDCPIP